MEPRSKAEADEAMRRIQLVCRALAGAVIVFAVAAWVVVDRPGGGPVSVEPPEPWTSWLLGGIGVFLLLMAPFVSGLIRRRAGIAPGDPSADPTAAVVSRFSAAAVVPFALSESAAALGLVVALLSGGTLWSYGLSAAALMVMRMSWPRREELDELLQTREAGVRAS